uniref:Uncharacterized protein n=1 Tax=Arundo donax TaxID=35708 RepID=A0A0A8Y3G7_ARUDO
MLQHCFEVYWKSVRTNSGELCEHEESIMKELK